MTGKELQARFGGTWDGGGREIHGLLDHEGRRLKIELLRASTWVCSVFCDGQCVATMRADDAERAVADAIETLAA